MREGGRERKVSAVTQAREKGKAADLKLRKKDVHLRLTYFKDTSPPKGSPSHGKRNTSNVELPGSFPVGGKWRPSTCSVEEAPGERSKRRVRQRRLLLRKKGSSRGGYSLKMKENLYKCLRSEKSEKKY